MKKTTLLLLFLVLQFCLGIAPSTAKAKAPAGVKAKKVSVKKPVRRKAVAASRHRSKPATVSRAKARSRRKVALARRTRPAARVRHVGPVHAAPVYSAGDLAGLNRTENPLGLDSNVALVIDQTTSETLFAKNPDAVLPIASITKLMTALVVLESKQDMNEILSVTTDDIDRIKHTSSRLRIGARLSRNEMLHIALMSSENRAASALGRHYPGGLPAFVEAMNAQARLLHMTDTHYVEPTGLSSKNVSSARDLAKLVVAAQRHPLIKAYSTHEAYSVDPGGPALRYINSNRLVRESNDWDIVLQKTGYIVEAGRCMVMQAVIEGRTLVMVFLDAKGKFSRAADANRMRDWLEKTKLPAFTQAANNPQG